MRSPASSVAASSPVKQPKPIPSSRKRRESRKREGAHKSQDEATKSQAKATAKSHTKEDFENWTWPDGDKSFCVPVEHQRDGTPHHGWALCQQNTSKATKEGTVTKRHFCLGVFECPSPGCEFVQHPHQPIGSKALAATPRPAKFGCKRHMQGMVCVRCEGGTPTKEVAKPTTMLKTKINLSRWFTREPTTIPGPQKTRPAHALKKPLRKWLN